MLRNCRFASGRGMLLGAAAGRYGRVHTFNSPFAFRATTVCTRSMTTTREKDVGSRDTNLPFVRSTDRASFLPDDSNKLHSIINGKPVDAVLENPRAVKEHATGQTLFHYNDAGEAEVEAAVAGAATAQREWSNMPGLERGRILLRAAELLRQYNDELAMIEAVDTGRCIAETKLVDVVSGADSIQYFGGLAPTIAGQHIDMGSGSFAYTRREPLGVCGGIGAWNYPLQGAAFKSAPALACGNAMVFKPAEDTVMSALELAAIYKEAGLPDGLFQVVLGAGDTGQLLSRHPDIAKVSFTGEKETGKAVCRDGAGTLKGVTMELGGKSPLIIFDDADMENAVRGALMANFFSAGQVCSNGTRVYVHRKIFDKFVARLVRATNAMKMGDPLDPKADIAGLITPEHADRVMSYILKGDAEGAKRVCGGDFVQPTSALGRDLTGRVFITPCIFTECKDNMTIVREEIFGPVMCVLPFDEEQEVVERANDTVYGLSAGVFTHDLNRAHRVIAQLQAGTTWINDYNLAPVELPWGGYKQSGLGRENGIVCVEYWTQLKSVYVQSNDVWCPYEL